MPNRKFTKPKQKSILISFDGVLALLSQLAPTLPLRPYGPEFEPHYPHPPHTIRAFVAVDNQTRVL